MTALGRGRLCWADTGQPSAGCLLSASSWWGAGEEGRVGSHWPGAGMSHIPGEGPSRTEGRRSAEPCLPVSAASVSGRLLYLTGRPARLGVCSRFLSPGPPELIRVPVQGMMGIKTASNSPTCCWREDAFPILLLTLKKRMLKPRALKLRGIFLSSLS